MKRLLVFATTINRKRQLWLLVIIGLFLLAKIHRGSPFTAGELGLIGLCFFCELMDSSLGMGYGTTLTPVLLAFGFHPLDLVPTILLSEFLSGFASSYFHHDSGNVDFSRRSRDFRVALLLAVGSVAGVFVGVSLALEIPTRILKLAIGLVITGAGIAIWVFQSRVMKFRTWKMFALATVASFNKSLSGGGYGPLMTSGQIISGVTGKSSVAITSFAEGFTCLAGVALYLGKGRGFAPDLLIPVLAGALLSVPFSTEAVRHMRENTLKRIIAALTVVMGLFTILKAWL